MCLWKMPDTVLISVKTVYYGNITNYLLIDLSIIMRLRWNCADILSSYIPKFGLDRIFSNWSGFKLDSPIQISQVGLAD